MEISPDIVSEAYLVAKRAYEGELSKEAAVTDLCQRLRVNRNSARDMVNNVAHMIKGERYVRNNNAFATDHFLGMIYRDYGSQALTNAISAVDQHLEYYAALPNGSKQPSIREIADKYREILNRESTTPYDGPASTELASMGVQLTAEGYFSATLIDERQRQLREIVKRRGQPEFRKKLIAVYQRRCAVTNCDAEPALEAAHILPYCGPQSNHVTNGLLLRGDIHILFDLDLLAIDPENLTVALATVLHGTSYAKYHGRRLALPAEPTKQPNKDAIARRWQRFAAQ